MELHNRVYSLGVPNLIGVRVVATSFNLSLWRSLLSEYSDQAVCEFLAFGWPIGFDYSCCGVVSSREFRNHKGALDFPSAVDSYLSTELILLLFAPSLPTRFRVERFSAELSRHFAFFLVLISLIKPLIVPNRIKV